MTGMIPPRLPQSSPPIITGKAPIQQKKTALAQNGIVHVDKITAYKPGDTAHPIEGGANDAHGNIIGNHIIERTAHNATNNYVVLAANRGFENAFKDVPNKEKYYMPGNKGLKVTIGSAEIGTRQALISDTGATGPGFFSADAPLHLDVATQKNPDKVGDALNKSPVYMTLGWVPTEKKQKGLSS